MRQYLGYLGTDHLQCSIAQELYFWLSLSEETSRSVFLLLCFDNRTFADASRMLKRLTEWPAMSAANFDGLAVTSLKNATRIHLKNGRIKLAICRAGDLKARYLV